MPTEEIREPPQPGDEANAEEDDLDVEMTLLALTEDMDGGPTEDVDISALSPTERRALLHFLEQKLGLAHKTRINNGKDSSQ